MKLRGCLLIGATLLIAACARAPSQTAPAAAVAPGDSLDAVLKRTFTTSGFLG